jgi:hypothetical protein
MADDLLSKLIALEALGGTGVPAGALLGQLEGRYDGSEVLHPVSGACAVKGRRGMWFPSNCSEVRACVCACVCVCVCVSRSLHLWRPI